MYKSNRKPTISNDPIAPNRSILRQINAPRRGKF